MINKLEYFSKETWFKNSLFLHHNLCKVNEEAFTMDLLYEIFLNYNNRLILSVDTSTTLDESLTGADFVLNHGTDKLAMQAKLLKKNGNTYNYPELRHTVKSSNRLQLDLLKDFASANHYLPYYIFYNGDNKFVTNTTLSEYSHCDRNLGLSINNSSLLGCTITPLGFVEQFMNLKRSNGNLIPNFNEITSNNYSLRKFSIVNPTLTIQEFFRRLPPSSGPTSSGGPPPTSGPTSSGGPAPSDSIHNGENSFKIEDAINQGEKNKELLKMKISEIDDTIIHYYIGDCPDSFFEKEVEKIQKSREVGKAIKKDTERQCVVSIKESILKILDLRSDLSVNFFVESSTKIFNLSRANYFSKEDLKFLENLKQETKNLIRDNKEKKLNESTEILEEIIKKTETVIQNIYFLEKDYNFYFSSLFVNIEE